MRYCNKEEMKQILDQNPKYKVDLFEFAFKIRCKNTKKCYMEIAILDKKIYLYMTNKFKKRLLSFFI